MRNISPTAVFAFIIGFIILNVVLSPSILYIALVAALAGACLYFLNNTTPQDVVDYVSKLFK